MVPFDEALERALAAARPLGTETVAASAAAALGRTLAEDVLAAVDVPGHDNAAMDGYAIRTADLEGGPATLRVVGAVPAGGRADRPVGPGEAIRIMTGAPIPEGADQVVEVEQTEAAGEGRVLVKISRGAGKQIRRRGEDLRRGAPALEAGVALGPAELGLLASLGRLEVRVGRAPRVAILSTGNEVVPPAAVPREGEVRDANSASLAAAALLAGARVEPLGIAPDDPDEIRRRLEPSAADVLVTSAGASRGDLDVMAEVARGWRPIFREVAMKPGRPVHLYEHEGRLFFALPGNPVAALVTFELLVRPALLRMQGRRRATRPEISVAAPRDAREKPGRTHFLRARIAGGAVAEVLPDGSGILRSMHVANALLRLEGEVRAGDPVRAILFGG